jgi:hypothetical protein
MTDGSGGQDRGYEIGRPRYGAPPSASTPGLGPTAGPRSPEPGGPGPDPVNKTAPAAIAALAFAAVGWLLPVIGGVLAIRRGTRALEVIAASGGALDGAPLAIWARRLGWCYVIFWSILLFYKLGGPAIQLIYSFVFK